MSRSPSSASSGTWWKLAGSSRRGPEQRHRRLDAIETLEQRGNAGQRDDQLGDISGLVRRADRGVEQCKGTVGLAVGGVQPRCVAGQEPVEEVDAVLADVVDGLVPGRQSTLAIGLRRGRARRSTARRRSSTDCRGSRAAAIDASTRSSASATRSLACSPSTYDARA